MDTRVYYTLITRIDTYSGGVTPFATETLWFCNLFTNEYSPLSLNAHELALKFAVAIRLQHGIRSLQTPK